MSAPAVLLSGFHPFDTFTKNSSFEMLRALEGAELGGHVIHTLEVPVVFGKGAAALLRRAEEVGPALVIAFGLADCPHIRLERRAHNIMDARIPDNTGGQPKGEPIEGDGPAVYPSPLPLAAMMEALEAASIPVAHSDTAGQFVCNDVFYRLMHWAAGPPGDVPCGFVHVPPLEGYGGKSGWEAGRLEEAARTMVTAALGGIR